MIINNFKLPSEAEQKRLFIGFARCGCYLDTSILYMDCRWAHTHTHTVSAEIDNFCVIEDENLTWGNIFPRENHRKTNKKNLIRDSFQIRSLIRINGWVKEKHFYASGEPGVFFSRL